MSQHISSVQDPYELAFLHSRSSSPETVQAVLQNPYTPDFVKRKLGSQRSGLQVDEDFFRNALKAGYNVDPEDLPPGMKAMKESLLKLPGQGHFVNMDVYDADPSGKLLMEAKKRGLQMNHKSPSINAQVDSIRVDNDQFTLTFKLAGREEPYTLTYNDAEIDYLPAYLKNATVRPTEREKHILNSLPGEGTVVFDDGGTGQVTGKGVAYNGQPYFSVQRSFETDFGIPKKTEIVMPADELSFKFSDPMIENRREFAFSEADMIYPEARVRVGSLDQLNERMAARSIDKGVIVFADPMRIDSSGALSVELRDKGLIKDRNSPYPFVIGHENRRGPGIEDYFWMEKFSRVVNEQVVGVPDTLETGRDREFKKWFSQQKTLFNNKVMPADRARYFEKLLFTHESKTEHAAQRAQNNIKDFSPADLKAEVDNWLHNARRGNAKRSIGVAVKPAGLNQVYFTSDKGEFINRIFSSAKENEKSIIDEVPTRGAISFQGLSGEVIDKGISDSGKASYVVQFDNGAISLVGIRDLDLSCKDRFKESLRLTALDSSRAPRQVKSLEVSQGALQAYQESYLNRLVKHIRPLHEKGFTGDQIRESLSNRLGQVSDQDMYLAYRLIDAGSRNEIQYSSN